MDKLLEPLLKAIADGSWGAAFVVVAIAVVLNLRPILEFLERRENRREEFVKDALKSEVLAGAARAFLEEELNYLLFRKVTGIAADWPLREKLKEVIDKANGEIQTFQLAKVKSHLRMRDGQLNIEIRAIDKVEWFISWCLAILIALLAVTIFILPGSIKGISILQVMTLMGMSMIFFALALFLVAQTIPLSTAKRIKPILERVLHNPVPPP